MTGRELYYIAEAHFNGRLAGDGPFTERCHTWLRRRTKSSLALLTHSCTAALEMASLLLEVKPGDEVVMPSYTFVSTANAFVLRGGVPVFVDIRPDTLNLDETLVADAIGARTRAVVPVHYAGIACEMDTIMALADYNRLFVVEDAAQGVLSSYKGRALGSIGHLGAYSFHETKNLISGEGGALLVNRPALEERAEIIREKGTDRSRFFRGEVDKYTWQDLGSSFLPGELVAAFLWAQLQEANEITERRLASWDFYHQTLKELEQRGFLRRPIIPPECNHNAHLYYIVLETPALRDRLIQAMREQGIHSVFHYVPLHSSPAGRRFGRVSGKMTNTDWYSARLCRLPLWSGISVNQQEKIVSVIFDLAKTRKTANPGNKSLLAEVCR